MNLIKEQIGGTAVSMVNPEDNFMKLFISFLTVSSLIINPLSAQDYCSHNFNPDYYDGSVMENLRPIDVVHYELNLTVEPAQNHISGTARIIFTGKTIINDKIDLDFSGLSVDSVYHEQIMTTFNHGSNLLSIDLGYSLNTGDTTSVTVFYQGYPQKGIYFRKNKTGETVVYSHNEPYDARYWIPCNDNPADKSTLDLAVWFPAGYRVLGNGILTGISTGPSGTIFAWKETYPIATYLVSIAAAPYQTVERIFQDDEGDILLQYYVYDGDQTRAEKALNVTAEMMGFFGSYIAPYPFRNEKYAMSTVPFREAAAMENQTATTMRDDIMDNEGIIAHELAHQWWGDAVSPEDFEHIWLNEGFASYFDALFTEHKYGRQAFEQHMQEYSGRIYTDGSLEYPILNPPPQYLFGRAVYFKGAWVLHMLRNLVGDENFREICRRYYQLNLYGNAVTQDLIAISENVTQRPLSNFYNQWLNYGGIPVLVGNWSQDNRMVNIELEQTQGEVIYDLEMVLRIEGSVRDTSVQVTLNTVSDSWIIDFPETVNKIVIDPENKILQRNNSPLYNIPQRTTLTRLYPNPFNRTVTIEYTVAVTEDLTIEIMNILGQKVKELEKGMKNNGIYSVTWDAGNSASGIYICRLASKSQQDYRKLILIK